jgi:ribose transport system permease protein
VLDSTFNPLEVNSFLKDVVRGLIIIAAVAVYARGTRWRAGAPERAAA